MGDEREDKKENEVYIMSDMLNRIHIWISMWNGTPQWLNGMV